jgi:eukaryotic-like serine/threonine-protein kinase
VGRYELYARIATGGMASVYFGRLIGPVGFSRTVAIKRLHPQFAQDPEFVAMFLDEARLAGRIRHPNVIPTLDVVALQDELFLVMEYVQGESLGRLVRSAALQKTSIPLPVLTTIFLNVLDGLHAAHQVTDDAGRPLGIVHRDVSPQNIIVGVDGVTRVLDFGVAKASGRVHHTKSGMTKGKVAYMAPEQVLATSELTRAADVYGASVCLWEALTGKRLFQADSEPALIQRVLTAAIPSPRDVAPLVPDAIAELTLKGLSRDKASRFATAQEMALALAAASRPATSMEVAEWVRSIASEALSSRAAIVAAIERDSDIRVSKEAREFVDRIKVDPIVTLGVDVEGIDIASDEPSRALSSSAVVATASTVGPPAERIESSSPTPKRAMWWTAAFVAVAAIAAFAGVAIDRTRSQPAPVTIASAPPSAAPVTSAVSVPVPVPAPVPAPTASAAEQAPATSAPLPKRPAPVATAASPGAGKPPVPPPPPKPAQASDGLFDRR